MVALADPRPLTRRVAADELVVGGRCPSCAHVTAADTSSCPLCGASLEETLFGPCGTVFASTYLHVGVPGHEPPYALAYLVLDEGPRVLVHTDAPPATVGQRLVLDGRTAAGDLMAAPAVEVTR